MFGEKLKVKTGNKNGSQPVGNKPTVIGTIKISKHTLEIVITQVQGVLPGVENIPGT